ncbi:MAG: SRPBCC domain-containing protein [Archangium sp.]|nr:SRPBCC domain-containing protein [Archangium sp.]
MAPHQARHQVRIHAAPLVVWRALTTPELMTRWMGEPSMQLEVNTTWTVGNPIRISGFHHARFENTGTVLEFEPPHALRYSHLSSLSRRSATPEH